MQAQRTCMAPPGASRTRKPTGEFASMTEGLLRICNYTGPVTKEMMRSYRRTKDDEYYAAAAIMLEGNGMPREFARFFAAQPHLDELSDFLCGFGSILERTGLQPSQVASIFLATPKERWKEAKNKLAQIEGWLRFAPEKEPQQRRIELATLLGRASAPPENERDISGCCSRAEERFINLLSAEDKDERLLDAFIELKRQGEMPASASQFSCRRQPCVSITQ